MDPGGAQTGTLVMLPVMTGGSVVMFPRWRQHQRHHRRRHQLQAQLLRQHHKPHQRNPQVVALMKIHLSSSWVALLLSRPLPRIVLMKSTVRRLGTSRIFRALRSDCALS